MPVTGCNFPFSLHDLLAAITAFTLRFGSSSVDGMTAVAVSTLALGCWLKYRAGPAGESSNCLVNSVSLQLFREVAIDVKRPVFLDVDSGHVASHCHQTRHEPR